MKCIIRFISLIALVFAVNISVAQVSTGNLKNVITVSAKNADFTSPVWALRSIRNAASNNPYLVTIGPGVYYISRPIVMKEWVTIQGAGQEATKIIGAISTLYPDETSAIVKGKSNAALTDLTLINRGGSVYSIAMFNSDASPRIERVTAEAFGASEYATGILNENSSSPVMTNVSASASGLTVNNYGVYNVSGSSPTMVNVNANATGGSSGNPSVYIGNAAPFIVDSVLDGSPGLELEGDSSGSRIVNNKIIGDVVNNLTGVVLAVTTTSGSICRGNYDENLMNVYCQP